ncbi:MAG: hypothetical protein HC836_16490 [Richelia sp. RM2_1_2]|nr:hypothetical protein [Richelia sp. RM2_1_2]
MAYFYPAGSFYTFKSLQTRYNEYTLEAHFDLKAQAQEQGWTCVDLRNHKQISPKHKSLIVDWLDKNNIAPLNLLASFSELWFERESDALLFKLTWC